MYSKKSLLVVGPSIVEHHTEPKGVSTLAKANLIDWDRSALYEFNGSKDPLIIFIDHKADRSGLPLLVQKRRKYI